MTGIDTTLQYFSLQDSEVVKTCWNV